MGHRGDRAPGVRRSRRYPCPGRSATHLRVVPDRPFDWQRDSDPEPGAVETAAAFAVAVGLVIGWVLLLTWAAARIVGWVR